MSERSRRLVTLVPILGLGLVACGGRPSEPPSAPTEPTPTTTTASATPTPSPPAASDAGPSRDAPPSSDAERAERERRAFEDAERAIREISPTEHAIPRKAFDALLENRGALMRAARFVPEKQNGAPAGVRIFGVRPDGLLGRLGFKNGDRLERVLGKPVATEDDALAVLGSAQKATVIEMDLMRQNAPLRLVLRIEP